MNESYEIDLLGCSRCGVYQRIGSLHLGRAGLAEDAAGFQLFPALEIRPGDLDVKKIHYSAFRTDSSRLDEILRARGIETVLIAGTATNVCGESPARDAMMLDYRIVMLSDANAAATDAEHAASLDAIALFFGDVMTVDEAARTPVARGRAQERLGSTELS